MWFQPLLLPPKPVRGLVETIMCEGREVAVCFVRNLRARRYVLRLQPDHSARVTIPRGGSFAEARHFLERHTGWLAKHLARRSARPAADRSWRDGTMIWFRGWQHRLSVGTGQESREARFADQVVICRGQGNDARPCVERHLGRLAVEELPPRVFQLAAGHALRVARVSVRNQRSRWGSCSRRGTISLNWRLIQAPPAVADYIILHELMHLREMNHSARFWQCVEAACPTYADAERWLKQHGPELR